MKKSDITENMTENLAEKIKIVLVNPTFGGNIGSTIRAMANMGAKELILVSPKAGLYDDETMKMAAGARPFVKNTKIVPDLKTALEDVHFAIAATARVGGKRRPFTDPKGAARLFSELETNMKGALVFGPEDAGLSNEDLFLCHAFARIPAHSRLPSLNLAQSVLIFLYELRLLENLPPALGTNKVYAPATAQETEEFFEHMEEALWKIEFLQPQDPDRILFSLRRLFSRVPRLEKREVKMLRGIMAHAIKAAKAANWPGSDFKMAYEKRLMDKKNR